jgi:hypothetical protein
MTSKRSCNGKSKGEMRGSLHCATDDKAVRFSGRDDEVRRRVGMTTRREWREGPGKYENNR